MAANTNVTDQKHYLDHAGLVALIKKIKAADAAALKEATDILGITALAAEGPNKSTIVARLAALEGLAGETSVAAQILAAIQDLDATVDSTGGEKVSVQVVEEDGVITGVTVTENNIASKDALDEEIARAQDAEDDLQDAIDAEEAARKAQIGDLGKVGEGEDAADQTVKGYVDAKIEEINGDADALEDRVEALEATHAKKTVGEGEDAKEVFKTVSEEVSEAIALVVADAPAKFDTLKEIADWIANSEDQSAANAEALVTTVDRLDGAVTVEGSVKKQIKDAIDELAGEAESENGTFVNVKVTTENGEVTAVSVTENDIASDAELKKVEALIGAAELGADDEPIIDRVAALEDLAGTESVEAQINAAIDALAGEATSTDGTFVNVTVTTENGEVKSVSVAEEDIASAALLGTAADAATANTAFGKAAAAQAAADAAQADVDALDELVGFEREEGEDKPQTVVAYVDAKIAAANAAVEALDFESTQTAALANGYINATLTQENGKITAFSVNCALEPCSADDINALFDQVEA